MRRWSPSPVLSKKEEFLLKRLRRTRKLFAFLRLHRHELFDDGFQIELEGMYRDTGAGDEPVPPALMCMVTILQGYLGISDAEAVELSIVDARWQMVLGCLGAEEPLFSQGGLQGFRERLIAADMDRRLLERTIELAKKTKEFDWKKLPKNLRLAVDSRPLEGAGRVEDTFNLLGHAARKIVECAAVILKKPRAEICRLAGIPLLLHSSVKAGLDVNWSDPEEKEQALEKLVGQVTSLHDWIEEQRLSLEEPIRPYIEAVAQVHKQDLDETAQGVRIRQGVAEDRRVSVEDPQMRHGRKSKSKRFNGYKQHIAADLDTGLIAACAVTPANRPEEESMPQLKMDIDRQGRIVGELAIDRAYINSTLVSEVIAAGGEVVAKPWAARNIRGDMFTKADFTINMRSKTITCPAGQVEAFEPGDVVEFDPEHCGPCPLRSQCTFSHRVAVEQSRLPGTSNCSIDSGNSRQAPGAAPACGSALGLSITSHTYPLAKVQRPDTRGAARTFSTSGARRPSKTSRPINGSWPYDSGFNLFGALGGRRAQIDAWLDGDPPLRLVRAHELLARDGVTVGYTTLRRFASRELGWRKQAPTVRLDDPPAGQEAQIT